MTYNYAFIHGNEANEAQQRWKLCISRNNQPFPNFVVTSEPLNFTPICKVLIFLLYFIAPYGCCV